MRNSGNVDSAIRPCGTDDYERIHPYLPYSHTAFLAPTEVGKTTLLNMLTCSEYGYEENFEHIVIVSEEVDPTNFRSKWQLLMQADNPVMPASGEKKFQFVPLSWPKPPPGRDHSDGQRKATQLKKM